jgi:RNA polymerase sigma-70 factor (ECF subfamily)
MSASESPSSSDSWTFDDARQEFKQLLEAARNGSKEAQGKLLEACRRPLLRLARKRMSPAVQAKGGASDVVQHALMKALEEIKAFQGCTPEELLAWLKVIVEHTTSNFSRQFHCTKRDASREASVDVATVDANRGRAVPSAADEVVRREQRERMRRALEQLPGPQAEIIRLRFEDQRSWEEIGQLTGRTAAAARQMVRRTLSEVGSSLGR